MRYEVDSFLRTFSRAFWNIIFPPRCHSCTSFIPDDRPVHLCDRCRSDMAFISSPLCTICGIPFSTAEGTDHCCSACMTEQPPFSVARAPLVHAGPARHLVHLFKYRHKIQLRRPLGLLMAEHLAPMVAATAPEVVVPVPLHGKKLRQRGYNQALLLGEVVAQRWGVPLSRHSLQRIRWTEPQTELAAMERRANVRGAFAVAHPEHVAGKVVALVDDVFTTGSTVSECARTLLRNGAAGVVVATAVRATPD